MKEVSRFNSLFEKTPFKITEVRPPNRKWVLCAMVNKTLGEIKIRTAYYDNNVFWEDAGSKAGSIDFDYWEIEEWIPLDN